MIRRDVGETCIFTGGEETFSPQATIVEKVCQERYAPLLVNLHEAGFHPDSGMRISLETLKAIVAWAEKK